MPVISHTTLRDFGAAIFQAAGVPADQAQIAVDHLVESNLMGHDSHGIMRLPGYTRSLVKGDIKPEEPTLVRIHSQCLTGDVLGSLLCDCGSQLHQAMTQVAQAGKGCVLYMRQEGRGIGLLPKLMAYKLQQEEGMDTVEANQKLGYAPDLRQYGIGAQILFDLGIRDIRLLTNNPRKIVGLEGYGITVAERVSLEVAPTQDNVMWLRDKRDREGYLLSIDQPGEAGQKKAR